MPICEIVGLLSWLRFGAYHWTLEPAMVTQEICIRISAVLVGGSVPDMLFGEFES